MIIDKNNMAFSAIQDDKAVMREIEQYANAGIDILTDEVLADFVTEKDDELCLDKSALQELPKLFLHYIFDQQAELRQSGNTHTPA